MDRHKPATGRPRLQPAAAPELEGIDSLGLARWAAAAASAGLSRSSAAAISGTSRRTLQRALRQHGADPLVARDLQLSDALAWERQGAEALREACSRATAWMRQAASKEGAAIKEVAAAFGATVAASHRLAEIGSRRARRLQPEQPQQQNRADIGALIEQLGQAAEAIRALPEGQRDGAWERVREGLRPDQPGQAEPIDVQVVEALEAEPPACPL